MNDSLENLRGKFGQFLMYLFWLHVPVLMLFAAWGRHPVLPAALAGALIAITYQLCWWRYGTGRPTRLLSAAALVCEPALLLVLTRGDPWQMDMHMYFFALLALTIAWFDRAVIHLAAGLIVLHHLLFMLFIPSLAFIGSVSIGRVMLHGVIVLFQAAVLIWLVGKVQDAFARISGMSQEIMDKNLTLEARAREVEKASQTKGIFLANVSHEIRTPINALRGFSHLLMATPLQDRQVDYLRKINTAGDMLLRFLEDVLTYSKADAGMLVLDERDFDLDVLLRDQVDMLSDGAARKGISIICHWTDSMPRIHGDDMRIGQILMNLLSNAIKFTERGQIEVRVTCEPASSSEMRLRISITDSGIGMTQKQIASIFEAFVQADSSTTRQYGGTGLGLAICRQIVNQMNGTIAVESRVGKGSTFHVTLPLRLSREQNHSQLLNSPSSIDRKHEEVQKTVHALVVDDNELNLDFVSTILRRHGVLVTTALNGLDACLRFESDPEIFDLVFMDIQMPIMDGMATARRLREKASAASLPIIALTANDHDDHIETYINAGMNDCIAKPVHPAALIGMITKTISHSIENRSRDRHISRRDDIRHAIELGGNDEELFGRLWSFLEINYPSMAAEIAQHIQKNDFQDASRIAHKMQGGASALGLKRVEKLTLELQEPSKIIHTTASDITSLLIREIKEAIITYKSLWKDLSRSP